MNGRDPKRIPRVALYSHDTMGLGHIRRNLLIAQAMVKSALRADVLLLSGTARATSFFLPPNVDCVTVPSLMKFQNGEYRAKNLSMSLEELIRLRSRTIQSALKEFDPDIFIVDKVPSGALQELSRSLESLRRNGRTVCVLGLRDILDDPATVRKEWTENHYEEVIREFYDAVWIYGDPTFYDLLREYDIPADIRQMSSFTGYHDQSYRLMFSPKNGFEWLDIQPATRIVVCLVGGGQDGALLAETFAQVRFPPGMIGVILTGPFMPRSVLAGLENAVRRNSGLRLIHFVSEPAPLLKRADRFIAMAGYNTACEILSFEKPSLIVPRIVPRKEQLIRAERMKEFGLADVLYWENISADAMNDWLNTEVPRPKCREKLDLNGLERIPNMIRAMLSFDTLQNVS